MCEARWSAVWSLVAIDLFDMVLTAFPIFINIQERVNKAKCMYGKWLLMITANYRSFAPVKIIFDLFLTFALRSVCAKTEKLIWQIHKIWQSLGLLRVRFSTEVRNVCPLPPTCRSLMCVLGAPQWRFGPLW